MKMAEVKAKAEELGIKPGRMKKEELIRQIQRTEGNFDCFGTATEGRCDQTDCCWQEDCLK
ncbi:MAG: Rho termination factor N-terminal domain-containing protein [bacterium]